jgi:hypothetical protein
MRDELREKVAQEIEFWLVDGNDRYIPAKPDDDTYILADRIFVLFNDREWRGLVDKAVSVLQRHIVPDGLSDHDALTELYRIFDGPEYRNALLTRTETQGEQEELRAAAEGMIDSACPACGSEPGVNIDCAYCMGPISKLRAALSKGDDV